MLAFKIIALQATSSIGDHSTPSHHGAVTAPHRPIPMLPYCSRSLRCAGVTRKGQTLGQPHFGDRGRRQRQRGNC